MANNLFIDTKDLKKVTIKLGELPKQIPGATASALNRTVDFTVTQTAREVTKRYAISQKEVKKTIKKHKASKSNLYAYVESKGNTIALHKFPHTPKKFSKKAKVKVQVIKSGGKKSIGVTPPAFVQKMNSTTGIWKREGQKRTPVTLLRTLSVPQMITNDETLNNIQQAANKKLQERIDHEIEWRLNKAGAK